VVLYIEDEEVILNYWIRFIRENWSDESQGSRSLERALELLNGGFTPDLAIFDGGILRHEDDDIDEDGAGRELYYELKARGIPVGVLSGKDRSIRYHEPFRSAPPELGIEPKPVMEHKIRAIVARFQEGAR
jgi:hypothetical protein